MITEPLLAPPAARILIVDDERHNRQVLEIMLGAEGAVLLTAGSGEEALGMVAQQPPDLILLDVMMAGMDGYQVAARIKGDPATKNIPIIMVTALDDRNARMLGLMAGAEDFLAKPVDRAELCVRVRNLLRLKAYGDHYDRYSQELVERTKSLEQQAAVLTQQAALLDLAQDAIVVLDMDSRVLFWSRGAEVLYGWFSHEAVGRRASELFNADMTQLAENTEVTLLREGRSEGEAIHHKRDGTRVIVASRSTLQRDAAGAPVRILTINNDITGRKQADAERREAADALEQTRADQMRFKDDFLSHVSHELRSPLTAIKQFTTILLGGLAGELNKEQREYQQIVLKNIRQLQSMIDDLLEVTRLETGKLTVDPERVSVSEALADTLETLQETARLKGISLSPDLSPDLPSAHADQTRLRQILIILLDNAIKFTPGGGTATIRARRLEADPGFLLVEVSDTGCGIAPEMADRIFERLYQVSDSTQASRKGLGLGLYICKQLVTRQGGEIWIDRRSAEGATFAFTLPVFSLNNVIAPLLKNEKWPAPSVALLMVDMALRDPSVPGKIRAEWSYEARGFLQRCLLPDLDVLLPKMSAAADRERFFVAAFADEQGASVLVNRIQEQFRRHVKQTDLTLSVTFSMLNPPATAADASLQKVVTSMATHLEAAVKSRLLPELVHP